MSETFFIKKTAFDDAGDTNTREANSFIIGPGELDGPGGSARNSSLRLYGYGSLKWGEGIIENLYRLLENNACPAKEDGDHLPGGSPEDQNTNYLVASHPIMPKDEIDLGLGNGITSPVLGQQWFNTTNNVFYYYTDGSPSGWVTGNEGETILTGNLNLAAIYRILGSANPIDAYNTLPSNISDTSVIGNIGWNDSRYVNATGDAMTGILNLGGNRIENVDDPQSVGDVLTLNYANNSLLKLSGGTMDGDIIFPLAGSPPGRGEMSGIRWTGDTDTHRIFVDQYNPSKEVSRLVIYNSDNWGGTNDDYTSFQHRASGGTTIETLRIKRTSIEPLVPMNFNGNRLENIGNPNSSDDAMPRSYADSRYLQTAGGTVSGTLILDGSFTSNSTYAFFNGNIQANNGIFMNSKKITNLATPTSSADAANKSYVDNALATAFTNGGVLQSSNGYIIFSAGGKKTCIQWGTRTVNGNSSVTFNLPVAFNTAYNFQVSIYSGSRPGGGTADAWGGYFVSTSQANIWTAQDGAANYHWTAIGTIL